MIAIRHFQPHFLENVEEEYVDISEYLVHYIEFAQNQISKWIDLSTLTIKKIK